MHFLLPASLLVSIIILISLPASLATFLDLTGEYTIYLYLFSACVSGLVFYLLYINFIRVLRQKDMRNEISIMDIEAENRNLKSQLDLLENLVSRDSLTGIWNKGYCLNRLQEELQRVQRGSGTFSVLMVDLDHFKRINDNLGHLVGDEYLKALANLLHNNTRFSDIVCRYGGDEFFMILPDATLKGAIIVAEKLRHNGAQLELNPEYPLLFSIGICSNCEQYSSIEDIINSADMALYQAKKAGRNLVMAAPVSD